MLSNFVASIRADLDAIKDDLDEFVTTVRTDASAALGLGEDSPEGATSQGGGEGKYEPWEEELWNHPDLLCQDPQEDAQWAEFSDKYEAKDEEIEALLSGAVSDIVPELYKELVPDQTTHNEFFKRLVYHKSRLEAIARSHMKMVSKVEDEEETRWDEDSLDEGIHGQEPKPVAKTTMDESGELVASNEALKAELVQCHTEMNRLQEKVHELEQALARSEDERLTAQKQLEEALARNELPHKKLPPSDLAVNDKTLPVSASPEILSSSPTPASTTPSWEAVPSGGSSNEEPAVVLGDEEEDDWE